MQIQDDIITAMIQKIEEDSSIYYREPKGHPNKYIDRYSVKLEKKGWEKLLVFFKAKTGKKKDLEKWLVDNFLGVGINIISKSGKEKQASSFSRKLFHVTGMYDFILPLVRHSLYRK